MDVMITVAKGKYRVTKSIVRQMPSGLHILCQPFKVLGYVIKIMPNELATGIIESGGEYYTIPLDYELSKSKLACFRSVKASKSVEFKFSDLPSPSCRKNWWEVYCKMRDRAFNTHIYIC